MAQQLPDDSLKWKKGFHASFTEFRNNSPSIPVEELIIGKEKGYRSINKDGTLKFHRESINKEKSKKYTYIYGYSNGQDLFINMQLGALSQSSEFQKAEHFGRFAYFKKREYTSQASGPGMAQMSTTSRLTENVLDLKKARMYRLTKKTLKILIFDDTELLREFELEKNKNKKLKEYIRKYCERNKF